MSLVCSCPTVAADVVYVLVHAAELRRSCKYFCLSAHSHECPEALELNTCLVMARTEVRELHSRVADMLWVAVQADTGEAGAAILFLSALSGCSGGGGHDPGSRRRCISAGAAAVQTQAAAVEGSGELLRLSSQAWESCVPSLL